jgi:hypothetical protein
MIYRRTAAQWILMVTPLLAVVPSQAVQRAPQSRRERPAEIQPPDEKRINLDAFRAQFREFSRGPLHTRTRRAICAAGSGRIGCVAKVTIQAIGLSSDIAETAPLRGRIIGQIRNLDAQDMTEMDSLKPSSQADYYIYIDATQNRRARWNLLEVPNAREGVIRRIAQAEVHQCRDKPRYVWRRSDVDFAKCGDHFMQHLSRAELLSGSGLIRFASRVAGSLNRGSITAEPGKWYGCPWSCCT